MTDLDRVALIAERLEQSSAVGRAAIRRGSTTSRSEAWQVATALTEVGESARKIQAELIPRLLDGAHSERQLDEVLHEIGEEFRHILYHILDTKLFDYVVPPATS